MKILLDMDGVLVDFVGGACRAHRAENPYENAAAAGEYVMAPLFGMTREQFWAPMREEQFWTELEPTPECYEIVDVATEAVGAENVCLLTNPCGMPAAAAGKIEWIRRHLPTFAERFLIGPAKQFCAGRHTLLIDDYDENIYHFTGAGGGVILVPRPWNSAHQSTYTAVEWIEWCLMTADDGD